MLRACDWELQIELYPDMSELRSKLAAVNTRCENGYPVFDPSPPFRFGLPAEVTDTPSVSWDDVQVQLGCSQDESAVCSENGDLSAVGTDVHRIESE